jgi:hypothetical protein
MIAGVLDRLEWEHVEIRKNVETWRAKQPELAAALAVLVPGIITQLSSREALISEGLTWLERFEAALSSYCGGLFSPDMPSLPRASLARQAQ